MRITVLGGSGAWPSAEEPCSGFLLEHEGYLLLVDAGYAVLPQLLRRVPAERLDAVYISHGHPDHCVDLNPLLRARVLGGQETAPLPVYAPGGALDAVLALDRPGWLDGALERRDFVPGDVFGIGPFDVRTRLLPHSRPNAAARFGADGISVVYTGDGGPDAGLVELAAGADVLIAEASFAVDASESGGTLCSAREAGRQAAEAGVGRLVLTHLFPGSAADTFVEAASGEYRGPIEVAVSGLVLDDTPISVEPGRRTGV